MSGPAPPATDSAGYDVTSFSAANDPTEIITSGTVTGSVVLRAIPGNGGIVYIGFNSNVTTSNGFPLEAGDSLSLDIDIDKQPLWGTADTGGDEIRWLALE